MQFGQKEQRRWLLLSCCLLPVKSRAVIGKRAGKWFAFWLLVAVSVPAPYSEAASACVWKVTAPDGKSLYLAGSVHALRSTDYPLPPAYNRAFEAATHLAFEVDAKALEGSSRSLQKEGEYPRGDSLKAHVDPRTYDYLRRVFALAKVPEEKFNRLRPWALVLALQSAAGSGVSHDLGVDQYLMRRAAARSKPSSGLETAREHALVYSGLTDRQGEALLLMTFIPGAPGTGEGKKIMTAWRQGDADYLTRMMHESYRDFPSFSNRLLNDRNQLWIPKIESFIRSGRTYLVVAGAAHFGGGDGVVALLRTRGYKVEQL